LCCVSEPPADQTCCLLTYHGFSGPFLHLLLLTVWFSGHLSLVPRALDSPPTKVREPNLRPNQNCQTTKSVSDLSFLEASTVSSSPWLRGDDVTQDFTDFWSDSSWSDTMCTVTWQYL
jgi:hypothetical protein